MRRRILVHPSYVSLLTITSPSTQWPILSIHTHTQHTNKHSLYTHIQIYGDQYHKSIYTMADIVNPDSTPDEMSPDKFRVYLRNAERFSLTPKPET